MKPSLGETCRHGPASNAGGSFCSLGMWNPPAPQESTIPDRTATRDHYTAAAKRHGSSRSAGERATMPALLGIVLGLRLLLIPFYRVDSDEPQHLHVAWGWSQGWCSIAMSSTTTFRCSTC